MQEFLRFFDEIVQTYPMHLEIGYSKICYWTINVYKKGCGENGKDLKILLVDSCDMEFCFAEAYVKLKNWLIENNGGY